MSLRLALPLILLTASNAFAQAPGEMAPTAPAPTAPVAANPCGGCDVMRHRISIGFQVGGLSATASDSEVTSDFDVGELALRFRMTPHLELELLLGGGRQVLESGDEGDLAMATGTLGLRYRFRPGHRWDWWLSAGLGATVIERHDASEELRDSAQRPHFSVGLGLERRWNRFALQLEGRMLALGQRESTASTTVPVGRLPGDVRNANEITAGTITLGAGVFF